MIKPRTRTIAQGVKHLAWATAALGALALGAGCGDDDNKQPQKDGAAARDGAAHVDTGTPQPDSQAVDKGATTPDGTAKGCSPYFQATANSGKPCKKDSECTADEVCLMNDAGTGGECTGKCCADLSLGLLDAKNSCPVADSKTQRSVCMWALTDETTKQDLPYMGCTFVCSLTIDGKTTTYTCPNATDTCLKSPVPELSFCEPQ